MESKKRDDELRERERQMQILNSNKMREQKISGYKNKMDE
jgi:hypothetical protein